jgi:hypothetical protein
MRASSDVFRIFLSLALLICLATPLFGQDPGATGVSVTTWQNDTHRTGRNLNEATLVAPLSGFGQLCNVPLDGQVYAQPLVETNVHISGTFYPNGVAYVVTQNDTLYAINGTPTTGSSACSIVASLPLLPILTTATGHTNSAVACSGVGSGGCPVDPVIGILGTPVINVSGSTGTIYLVTFSQDTLGNYYHYLHAINIQTMVEETGSPVRIAPPGSSGAQASSFSFQHIQRPGLLFAGGYVYAAFSMIDGYLSPYPNGAVFGFNTSNLAASPLYFQTSLGLQTTSNGGGIWQGGAAPAYGRDGGGGNYIYLKTANGTFDGSTNWGSSFLKLDPTTLTVPTGKYFTPADQYYRSTAMCTTGYQGASPQPGDMDFGSGGVMLIPDSNLASWPYLAVSGDKEGGIWFNDRTTPATPAHVTTCDPSNCSCSAADGVVQAYWTSTPNFGQVIHTSPAYWQGGGSSYLYLGPQSWAAKGLQGNLQRYPLCSGSGSTFPIDSVCGGTEQAVDPTLTAVSFPYGVTPAISAASNSASDAIVWAIWGDGSALTQTGSPKVAVLYAFDAADVNAKGKLTQLFASSGSGSTCAGDTMTVAATKFSVPTVANTYVYVGAQGPVGVNGGNVGIFYIFGQGRNCP